MKQLFSAALTALVILIVTPIAIHAQSAPASGQKPPIAQPLVREGDLAVKLVDALKMGTTHGRRSGDNCIASFAGTMATVFSSFAAIARARANPAC